MYKKKSYVETEYYSDGQVMCIRTYKNGILNGNAKGFYPSGLIMYDENYKNGKFEGQAFSWYSNGQLLVCENYKNGKLNGLATSWFSSGELKSSELFYNDIRYPKNLVSIQRIIKSKLKLKRFIRLVTSKKFCEWFWDPRNTGGKWAHKYIEKTFSLIFRNHCHTLF